MAADMHKSSSFRSRDLDPMGCAGGAMLGLPSTARMSSAGPWTPSVPSAASPADRVCHVGGRSQRPAHPAVDGRLMAMVPDYRMNLVMPRRVPDEELDAAQHDRRASPSASLYARAAFLSQMAFVARRCIVPNQTARLPRRES